MLLRAALFVGLLALVLGQQVTCRCQKDKADRTNPTYPSISECKIPNSDDYLSSFIEDDSTWNPEHEFPAGSWAVTPDPCPTATQACQQTLKTTDGKWSCGPITPKCWEDLAELDGSDGAPYNCAALDNPKKTGETCPVKCKPGYTLSGGPAQCQNGDWANLPTCANAGCGAPPTDCGGVAGCKYTCTCPNNQCADGTTCALSCPAGTVSTGNAVCDKGQWDPEKCITPPAVGCTGPATPAPTLTGAKYNCGAVPNGGTCPLHCPYGYTPAGNPPKCDNGKWVISTVVGQKPHCKCQSFEKIQENTPLACVFGGADDIDRLDFIVDVSGSMTATFKVGAKTWTRMDYVKQALADAIMALDPDQSFNIIQFSDNAAQWQSGVVIANAANKATGVNYAKGLKANGGTNMLAGFQLAFKDPKVQGVFMLTDGVPTGGYGPIHPVVKDWNKRTGGKVYPVAFQVPASSEGDLRQIAQYTGGKFHHVV